MVDNCNLHFFLTFLCILLAVSIAYETEIRNNLLQLGKIIVSANKFSCLSNIREPIKYA